MCHGSHLLVLGEGTATPAVAWVRTRCRRQPFAHVHVLCVLDPVWPLAAWDAGEMPSYALEFHQEGEEAAGRAQQALGLAEDRIGVTIYRGSFWRALRAACAEQACVAVIMDAATAGRSLERISGTGCRVVVVPAVAPSPLRGTVVGGPWIRGAAARR